MGGIKDKSEAPKKDPPRPVPPARPKSTVDNSVRAARAQTAQIYRKAYDDVDVSPTTIRTTTTKINVVMVGGIPVPFVTTEHTDRLIMFDLEGKSKFGCSSDDADVLWPARDVAAEIPVRVGDYAKGTMLVSRSPSGVFYTTGPQLLLLSHPALPIENASPLPALAVELENDDIHARLVLVKEPAHKGFLPAYKELLSSDAVQLLGIEDLQNLTVGEFVNQWSKGELDLQLKDLKFLLDGVFPGTGSFSLWGTPAFSAQAEIEAKGIERAGAVPQTIPLTLDRGGIHARGSVKGHMKPRDGHELGGDLHVAFENGVFDIEGKLTYKWSSNYPKIDGTIEVRLTDLATARNAIRDRLGKYAPPDPAPDTAPNGLALWGEGGVDFTVNKWLTGHADVVVDPDGFVTVVGRLETPGEFQLMGKKDLSDLGIAGVPLGGTVNHLLGFAGHALSLGGSASLTPSGSVGPAIFDDFVLEGVYTTYPEERLPLQFSVEGRFSIPAELSLSLHADVDIAEGGVVGAGFYIDITGSLKANGSARPKLGKAVPPGGGEPTFFFKGALQLSGALSVTVDVGVEANVDLVFWKKEVAYPIASHTFDLGRAGLAISGEYYFGNSTTKPSGKYSVKRGHDEYGFNNEAFSDRVVNRQFDGDPSHEVHSSWYEGNYPAARHFHDVEAATGQPEEAVGTGALAAGGIEPHVAQPTEPAPPPPAPPSATIASATPTVPTVPTAPTTTPPGTTTSSGGSSPPPPPPPSPPAPPGPAPPLQLNVTMVDMPHVLLLYRAPPVQLTIGPPVDRLRYKITTSEKVLRRYLDEARAGNSTIRTETQLQDELDELGQLETQTADVEEAVHQRLDPYVIPTTVPEFEVLADAIEAYASLFDRTMFFDESYLRGRPSPVPALLPTRYQTSQVLRQLERAQPGRVNSLILVYNNRYVANFYLNSRRKPTQTPMTELDYLEMRARFILGMIVETPILDRYSTLSGIPVVKNNFPIYILDPAAPKVRTTTRKPDFFRLGTILGDVKNVREQGESLQMDDNFRILKADNVQLGPGLAGVSGGRTLLSTETTPRFDLIVRVPWHPRGATTVAATLANKITAIGGGSQIWELIDDPSID